ncbi:hypothetical protein D3C71_1828380 [compost metagenome]
MVATQVKEGSCTWYSYCPGTKTGSLPADSFTAANSVFADTARTYREYGTAAAPSADLASTVTLRGALPAVLRSNCPFPLIQAVPPEGWTVAAMLTLDRSVPWGSTAAPTLCPFAIEATGWLFT